jgi:hypothetical protein
MRFALPLLTACLLAGCNGTPAQPTIKEKETARAAEMAKLKGWDRFFGAPDATIGAANQFGFHAPAYAASGHVWRSTGGPTTIAGSEAKVPNRVWFTAEGPGATQVDTIRFDLGVGDPKTAKDAGKRFAKLVRDFLFQAGIEADALVPAIEQGVPARGDLQGAPYSIEKSERDDADGTHHVTVTFTRTGATAPTSPTQGK